MSIKIAIDNNFFDHYYLDADDKNKRIFDRAVLNHRISLYPTIELFSELIGLYETKRWESLFKYSRFLLDYKYRFLKGWNEIIRIELGVEMDRGIYLDSSTSSAIDDILGSLSKEKIPNEMSYMLKLVEIQTKPVYDYSKKSTEKSLKYLEDNPKVNEIKKIRRSNIRDIYMMKHVIEWRKKIIKQVFDSSFKPISNEDLDYIALNDKKYPYLHTYIKLVFAMNHSYVYLRRRIRNSDFHDRCQLVYINGLDYFITNDDFIINLAENVLEKQNKVINFDKFIELLSTF